jgi:hypothetical protein
LSHAANVAHAFAGSRRWVVALGLGAVLLGACGSGGGGESAASDGTAADVTGSGGTQATGGTEAPDGTGAGGTEATDESLPVAATNIVGLVVGGSGGGVGQGSTDSLSEVVREEDGSCAGWAGPGGAWTADVKEGAEVRLFDAEQGGHQLATGTLGKGAAADVAPPKEQWQCTFPVTLNAVPAAEHYFAEVDSLPRVEARADPAKAGQLVIPVSTRAKADLVSACKDPQLPATVGEWKSVGQYWSQGIPAICSAGLRISRLERVCRPKDIATDRVVTVVDPNDGRVFEDSSGLKVDPASLTPGTIVLVRVSTAYPCT